MTDATANTTDTTVEDEDILLDCDVIEETDEDTDATATVTDTAPTATVDATATAEPAKATGTGIVLSTEADARVDELASNAASLVPYSAEMRARKEAISKIGADTVEFTRKTNNHLLKKTLKDMRNAGSGSAVVANHLIDLQQQVDKLNPDQSGVRGFINKLPFGAGNQVERYVRQYQGAEPVLENIRTNLFAGKEMLMRDSSAIEQKQGEMYEAVHALNEHISVAKGVDAELSEQVEEIRQTDPVKAEEMELALVFPARQRTKDLMTHQAVVANGFANLRALAATNVELINSVDRATNTTQAALEQSVMIAAITANQTGTVEQINALNNTTNKVIVHNAQQINKNTEMIAMQAMDSGVSLESLQTSFAEIKKASDTFQQHRATALTTMSRAIVQLEAGLSEIGNELQLESPKPDETKMLGK